MSIAMVAPSEAKPQSGVNHNSGRPQEGKIYFPEVGEYAPFGYMAVARSFSIREHCHPVDQFQILLPSPGALYEGVPIDRVTIHYTDAYVTFGPHVAGDPPLRFFNLRARGRHQTLYMPEDRDSVPYRGRRHLQCTLDAFGVEDSLRPGEITRKVIIEDLSDGLEVCVITAGPGATPIINAADAAGGQYLLVVDGDVTLNGATYAPESLGWQAWTDGPAQFIAGSQGCRLIITRFPSPESKVTHISS